MRKSKNSTSGNLIENDQLNGLKDFAVHLILSALTFLIALIIISQSRNTSCIELINQFLRSMFVPNMNIILPAQAHGLNFNILIYISLFLSLISSLIFKVTLNQKINIKNSIILTTLSSFIIFQSFQTIKISLTALEEKKFFSKTKNERQDIILMKTYPFIKFCKIWLKGNHKAKFLTDIDTSHDPGMLMNRIMAYHLYPIDIREIHDKPCDSIITYAKQDASQSIPNNYKIIAQYNNSSLIAIKISP